MVAERVAVRKLSDGQRWASADLVVRRVTRLERYG
jgi:hypothetical protein